MSKIEHTPGPWRTDQKYPGVVIGGTDEHGRPCQVASATLNGFRTVEEQHANARVVAAAPELLAALQCALFDLEQTYSHVSSVSADRIKSETIPLARAAIAKAVA